MHNLATIYAANILAGDVVKCGPDDFRRVARVTTMNEGRYVSIVWERHTVPAGKNLRTEVRAERRMRVVPALVAPMGRNMGAGTACSGRPWNVRGCESTESWADVWNAWAERRSEAAVAAAERGAAGVTFGSYVIVAGQGSFGALGGGGTGRPALVDETGRRGGYFPAYRARAVAGYGSLGSRTRPNVVGVEGLGVVTRWAFGPPSIAPGFTGLVAPGWRFDRRRRSEAAAGVPLTAHAVHGWQVVGGVTAARLMAPRTQSARYGRDRGIVVTPAGLAALDRHLYGYVERILADGAYRAGGADAHDPTPCDCDAEGFTHGRRSTCPRGG